MSFVTKSKEIWWWNRAPCKSTKIAVLNRDSGCAPSRNLVGLGVKHPKVSASLIAWRNIGNPNFVVILRSAFFRLWVINGQLDEAHHLFDQMPKRHESTFPWNSLIAPLWNLVYYSSSDLSVDWWESRCLSIDVQSFLSSGVLVIIKYWTIASMMFSMKGNRVAGWSQQDKYQSSSALSCIWQCLCWV